MLLYRQFDLFGRELLAVDGTRIKAVNSKDRNFTRAALAKIIGDADDRLSKYTAHLDKGDADEAADGGDVGRDNKLAEKISAIRGRRERHKALLDELDRTGENQISLTDPDARVMARMTKVGVGYNVQLAVDTKHKLTVEQEVTNQVLDLGLLAPTVTAAMETLDVETIEAVADRGYVAIVLGLKAVFLVTMVVGVTGLWPAILADTGQPCWSRPTRCGVSVTGFDTVLSHRSKVGRQP